MTAYYMYQLHECFGLYGLPFRCRRLFQQYLVGVYCCIEQNRIDYYRTHQNDIRKDYLSGVFDAIHKGDRIGSDIGRRLILPRSFTGGPRYMYSHYLDALAICRVLGNPQFFITFTCNVNWTEIKRHMDEFPQITIADRADVVVRVFEQKVHEFCNFLQHSRRFGDVTGFLYTIEFKKQGLPHYPETDPEGYKVMSEMMVHGPCGPTHADAVCMKEGTCSKKYPKKYNNETFFDKDGHVHYQIRESDVYVARHSAELDNSNVVPFNRELCLTFHAHINVEYCGWSDSYHGLRFMTVSVKGFGFGNDSGLGSRRGTSSRWCLGVLSALQELILLLLYFFLLYMLAFLDRMECGYRRMWT
ncbi:DNA helicase [Tanacetum coccineum]